MAVVVSADEFVVVEGTCVRACVQCIAQVANNTRVNERERRWHPHTTRVRLSLFLARTSTFSAMQEENEQELAVHVATRAGESG
jgi:hypothetical protein